MCPILSRNACVHFSLKRIQNIYQFQRGHSFNLLDLTHCKLSSCSLLWKQKSVHLNDSVLLGFPEARQDKTVRFERMGTSAYFSVGFWNLESLGFRFPAGTTGPAVGVLPGPGTPAPRPGPRRRWCFAVPEIQGKHWSSDFDCVLQEFHNREQKFRTLEWNKTIPTKFISK